MLNEKTIMLTATPVTASSVSLFIFQLRTLTSHFVAVYLFILVLPFLVALSNNIYANLIN